MTTTECRYCRLPFKVRRVEAGRDYFCCTGCAMLARVPVDAQGQFPVNSHLIFALVTGFLYFNQLLFLLLAELLSRDATSVAQAARFGWLSAGTAAVVWIMVMFVQLCEQTARATDFVVATLVLLMHAGAVYLTPFPTAFMAVANALLLVCSLRGLLRRRSKSV
jgi:hypothetical protein